MSTRRTARKEQEPDAYRVYFWRRDGSETSAAAHEKAGYISDEREIRGAASVVDVLAWAEAERGECTFTLYAVVHDGPYRDLVHLAGVDPTQPEDE